LSSAGEFALIARFFQPLAAESPAALGLEDDAAVIDPPAGRQLVVTTDTIVEGVHFFGDDPPDSLGVKLLAVNLSDLAAMGAVPASYVLSVALPSAWPLPRIEQWLDSFTRGLGQSQQAYGVGLVGGDTVATPGPLTLTATLLGWVEPGGAMRRGGAKVDDLVFVSGTIGDAALGLMLRRGEPLPVDAAARAALIDRYQRPRPRLELGRAIAGLAHAAADISDGLIADLGHVAAASRVAAVIDAGLVPLSAAAAAVLDARPELLPVLLSGGDDYELVFTAPVALRPQIERAAAGAAAPVTCIGRISAVEPGGPGPRAEVHWHGQPLPLHTAAGYNHFRG
jgi:thiamine-monophosphate kinase